MTIERAVGGRWRRSLGSTWRIAIRLLLGYWAILLLLVSWEVYVRSSGTNVVVMPSVSAVIGDIIHNWGSYQAPLLNTLRSALIGLLGGTLLGTFAAVVSCWSTVASGVLSPALVILRSIPGVILVPIWARLFDYSSFAVIVIVTLSCLFPSFVIVASAMRAVPKTSQDLATAYGASRLRRFRYVELPASLPGIATALRFSAGMAFLIAMVTEFLTGMKGLGLVFNLARFQLDSTRAWGASLITAVVSVLLFQLALAVERYVNDRTT